MSLLTLRALGALEVTCQATTVTAFPTDKIRALLSYLALESDLPQRRERLAALFWPEIDQALALNNLRVTLHRLRVTLEKAQPGLGATLIESTRQTIRLLPTTVTTDVANFQALLRACTQHPHAHPHTCPACCSHLVEAVELYRGELLAGFGLADAPAFEEWLLLRREQLHQQAIAALHTLVQAYEAQNDDERAHHYASRQLLLDPSREEAHRQLMRSLARRGLRTEALAQFESCRRLLREQLDVDPDPATLALVAQVRAGELDRGQGDTRPETREVRPIEEMQARSLSPVALSPVALPPQDWGDAPEVSRVYGRQEELAALTHWLVDEPGVRVVAVLGIGGVGKTTLAAAAVESVASHFARVIWRSLLNAPPLEELLRDILQRLCGGQPAQFALAPGSGCQRLRLLPADAASGLFTTEGASAGELQPGSFDRCDLYPHVWRDSGDWL